MTARRLALALLLVMSLVGADALAQDAGDKYTHWNGARDKVGFHVGAFFVNHSTFARLQPRDVPDILGGDAL